MPSLLLTVNGNLPISTLKQSRFWNEHNKNFSVRMFGMSFQKLSVRYLTKNITERYQSRSVLLLKDFIRPLIVGLKFVLIRQEMVQLSILEISLSASKQTIESKRLCKKKKPFSKRFIIALKTICRSFPACCDYSQGKFKTNKALHYLQIVRIECRLWH